MNYSVGACGGTFDRFHKGHKIFLLFALSKCQHLFIGVTSDAYTAKKLPGEKFLSYIQRVSDIEKFIREQKKKDMTTIVPIDTMYGPTINRDFKAEVIISSPNTRSGAKEINKKRAVYGLTPLKIEVSPLILAEDGDLISSSRIRRGEINRNGTVYFSKTVYRRNRRLPEAMRSMLQKPFGKVFTNMQSLYKRIHTMHDVITVGDVVTKTVLSFNIHPHLAIVDYVVERKPTYQKIHELGFKKNEMIIQVENPSGTIMHNVCQQIARAFSLKKHTIIKINGEEDLAVLPVILAAPLGANILYGQPGKGVVLIVVSERTKEKAYKIYSEFSVID